MQLLRRRPAFEGCDVTYASVRPAYADEIPGERFVTVPDATRGDRVRLLRMMFRVAWLVGRMRPDVIVSTGAAPGYVAIRLGKLIGARTVWLDSIANVERISLSGQKIGPHADLWLTQWEHLATSRDQPEYRGAVI